MEMKEAMRLIEENKKFFIGLLLFFILFISWLSARGGLFG